MLAQQIRARGIGDPRVLSAMASVPRHRFVDDANQDAAYEDHPVVIGHGQTISQPYIVASMTELAAIGPGDKVLEIGTGSGYQTAVLAALGAEVFSIEIVAPLAQRASALLDALGYPVSLRVGDGYQGWPEEQPFAAILLTAAPPQLPPPLVAQLAPGGRLVAPVGEERQELVVVERSAHEPGTAGGAEQLTHRSVYPVRFVPMTGLARAELR